MGSYFTMERGNNAIRFTRLDAGDLEALLGLENKCFSSPWSAKQYNLAFEQKLFNVFGLKQDGQLLAYVSFYHIGEEMEIFNLAVSPGYRRHGLAKYMLGLVLQICRKMGIKYAFLEVRQSNVAARALYAGFHFSQVGVRKGYYPDNGEDALILRSDLQAAPLVNGVLQAEE